MNAPLRIGVVGCGGAAFWHMLAVSKIKDIEMVAVCDRDELLAKKAAGLIPRKENA